MTSRRAWLGLSAAALLPLRAGAQPLERMVRIGVLRPGARPVSPGDPIFANFRIALRELGYVEGRNLVLDERFAGGDAQRLPALARELVAARTEVIVAVGASAANAARDATASTPIVFFGNFDPVAIGLVGDLARPGGTLTGILIAPDGTLAGKRVELLRAAVPQATRIGLLVPNDLSVRSQVDDIGKAARALGVHLVEATVTADADYAAAFAALTRERVGALVVASHSFFMRDRQTIIDLAARHRLPAIYEWREQVVDGGLMAYSTSLLGQYRRIALYADRILKGTKAGDLPVDRPYRFELVINLKTARAIGLNIPQALLLRADEVIE